MPWTWTGISRIWNEKSVIGLKWNLTVTGSSFCTKADKCRVTRQKNKFKCKITQKKTNKRVLTLIKTLKWVSKGV